MGATQVIKLDPSSPLCYERKHAALRGIGHDDDATHAFEAVLMKMSSDLVIYGEGYRFIKTSFCYITCYIRPEQMRGPIRTTINDTIRDSRLVLINVASNRLCNKLEQACAFETTPAFTELISSMNTYIDNTPIDREVGEYSRYIDPDGWTATGFSGSHTF